MTRPLLRKAVPPLVWAGIVLAICWRVWTPIPGAGKAFIWDAQWEYWGDLALQVHAAEHVEAPLWNPYDRCGHPFMADPQTGTLYPVTWLLVALGLVAGAPWWLVAVKIMLHLWLWGLGMYVWLRRRGLPAAACYAAGVFCLLAFPTVTRSGGLFSALIWPMAWTPWVLAAVELFAERATTARAALVALALGLCELAGGPASFWYTLLVAVPYGAWALAHHRPARRDVARAALVAGGLFVAMVAGQVLLTAQLVPLTVRATRDLDFIAGSVLSSDNLFGLVVPRMPGINAYLGMVNVFAALIAVSLRPSGRTLTLAGIAAGGVLLALGSHGGWLPDLASVLPPAGLFRSAHRYLFVTLVPFAALAAEGIAALAALDGAELRRRVAWLFVGLGLVGAIVFGCGVVASGKGPHHDAYIIAFFSWTISAWALWQLTVSRRAAFVVVAALVACFDMWFAHFREVEADFIWAAPQTPLDPEARKLPGVPLEARVYDREYFKYRAGARLEIREMGGYEGDPLALRRYARFLAAAYGDPHLLGHANVRWVPGVKGPQPLRMPADFKPHGAQVWELPAWAPAVAWYPGATVVADEEQALAQLRRLPPGGGALLEGASDGVAAPDPARAPVAGRITELGLNRLAAEIDAPAPGVVVVAEAYHPGWRATVDGQPAAVRPANALLRGVLVGAGRHRIEMRFTVGALTGALLPLSILAFLAAAALAARRR